MKNIVKKVHMIIIMQPDIAKAIDFYKMLGLKLVFHIKDKWAEMQLGGIKIGLCPTSQSFEGHRTGIVLEVENLLELYTDLADTIPFVTNPKEATHGIMATFKDPGGNLLDLYQPTPEKVVELVKKTADAEGSDQSDCSKGVSCCKVKKTAEVAQG